MSRNLPSHQPRHLSPTSRQADAALAGAGIIRPVSPMRAGDRPSRTKVSNNRLFRVHV
jgi:hypothetical protein